MSALDAVRLVDDLYRTAIVDPTTVEDPLLVEWMEQAGEAVRHDREQAKSLRKAVRTARKLARYWTERDGSALPDWRNGVDEALGGRGWQCQLDLVMHELAVHPNPDLFDEAKRLHRAVSFTPWMEGVEYEDWVDG